MRPVILSRPENTAVGLVIRCGGGSTTTSSLGCGAVLAGCGALRGEPGPGGSAGGCGGATHPVADAEPAARWRRHQSAGRRRQRLRLDGAGRRAGWMAASSSARAMAATAACRGCWDNTVVAMATVGASGTSAGGRGGGSPKIEPNCANAGGAASNAASTNNATGRMRRAIKIRLFASAGVNVAGAPG